MIEIVDGSVVASSYGDAEITSSNLTINNLTLEAGDRFYIFYHYRNVQSIDIGAPVWNGQTAELVQPRFGPEGLFYCNLYRIVAAESATANLTAQVLGNNFPSQFTFLVSTRFIARGDFTDPAELQVQADAVLSVAGYRPPRFDFADMAAGDLLISLLATTAFDGDFNVEPATWAANGLSQLSIVSNATTNYSKTQGLGSYAGAGEATIGWDPSMGDPGWAHIAFLLKAAADNPEIMSINAGDPVIVGEPGSMVTANISAVVLSIGGIDVIDFTVIDADNYTYRMPWFTDGEVYPQMGSVNAIARDAEEPPSQPELATILALPADWTAVQYGTLSAAPDSLASMIKGAEIETGDHYYYKPTDLTIYDDSTISGAPTGTVETWLHKSSTNIVIQVLIINGLPYVPGSGWRPIEFIEKIDFIG